MEDDFTQQLQPRFAIWRESQEEVWYNSAAAANYLDDLAVWPSVNRTILDRHHTVALLLIRSSALMSQDGPQFDVFLSHNNKDTNHENSLKISRPFKPLTSKPRCLAAFRKLEMGS